MPFAGARMRYERDTSNFDRVLSFLDAIYGYALTLLVIAINVDGRAPWRSVGALLAEDGSELNHRSMVGWAGMRHTVYVTKKEQLLVLVDELGDEQLDELLQHASKLAADRPGRRSEPSWFGALRSGRGDLSERHEEILKSELGRSA